MSSSLILILGISFPIYSGYLNVLWAQILCTLCTWYIWLTHNNGIIPVHLFDCLHVNLPSCLIDLIKFDVEIYS
jgi:hypothetical protein